MEIWKDVKGFEGKYQVSNLGNVKSLNYNHTNKPHNLAIKSHHTGYSLVTFKDGEKYINKTVHILVAQAFIPNPNNYPVVNHIDGNKQNNYVENLEWATYSRNTRHAIEIGLRKESNMLGRTGDKNPLSKNVYQYNKQGEFVKAWDSVSDASRFYGCSASSIINVIHHRIKSIKGYYWSYNNPLPEEEFLFFSNHKANKPVLQYDMNMNFIREFPSTIAVEKELGFSACSISQCCRGNSKTSHGFIWRFRQATAETVEPCFATD